VDVIIYCTGYKVTFPFFDERFISAPNNELPLYRRIFKPDIGNVFFIGLLQPLGAIMPLAEVQSKLVARHLSGEYALPLLAEMLADIDREQRRMRRRYVASRRHTMQVDFDDHLHGLKREMRQGERRARRGGFRLPVEPRARARAESVAAGAR
jgi:hypothetical protein